MGDGAPLDYPGAGLLVVALGTLTFALTAWSGAPFLDLRVGGMLLASLVVGAVFLAVEHRSSSPLVPTRLFGSRVFVVANLATFLVYAALGALFFSLGLVLQVGAGRSPLAAGLALMPVTLLMLLLSGRVGVLMERRGARLPMALGPLLAALGVGLLTTLDADVDYVSGVLLPMTVFGAGLTLLVTPLTATVLAAAPDDAVGLASGVNNAVARTSGLLAVAAVPLVAGLGGTALTDPERVVAGFGAVAWWCVGLLLAASLLAAVGVPGRSGTLRKGAERPAAHHCATSAPPPGVRPVAEQEPFTAS